MIKIIFDNGETYTDEQYKKDYVRMMNSLRENDLGKKNCFGVNCNVCTLFKNTCKCNDDKGNSDYMCLETVKIVHDWAKKNPVFTNRDKIKDVFGFNMTSWDNAKLNGKDFDFNKWLNSEYKEPDKNEL